MNYEWPSKEAGENLSNSPVSLRIQIKIGISFIFRIHRRPIQLFVFVPVGLSSFLWHLRQVGRRSSLCRPAWAVSKFLLSPGLFSVQVSYVARPGQCRSFFCRPAWAMSKFLQSLGLGGVEVSSVARPGQCRSFFCRPAWAVSKFFCRPAWTVLKFLLSPGLGNVEVSSVAQETSTSNKTCQRCKNDERPTGTNTTNWMGRQWNLKIMATPILTLTEIFPSVHATWYLKILIEYISWGIKYPRENMFTDFY